MTSEYYNKPNKKQILLNKHIKNKHKYNLLENYNDNNNNVIKQIALDLNLIDIDIIKTQLKEYMNYPLFKQLRELSNTKNRILPNNISELIIYNSINSSELISSGNTPIDIKVNRLGIDVACLSFNGNQTNEKSMMQNFKVENLDGLFKKLYGNKIVEKFRKYLTKKLKNCKKTEKIEDIYYLVFFSNKDNVYLSCFEINIKNIKNIKYDSFTKSKQSIVCKNIIDDKIGQTKVYKAKKRIEIRFYKELLNSPYTIKLL